MITENHYLLDNNALGKISRRDRGSEFVRTFCRIPSEVLHEASGYPDIASLSELEYPTTVAVLSVLAEVMATVDVGDTSLIDLYHNRGNADPLLVACALDARRANSPFLFGEDWLIVSDDQAVQRKAAQFGVEFLSSASFLEVVRASSLIVESTTHG